MRLIAIFFLFVCSQSHANIVARVLDVKGNVFAFDSKGQSRQLGYGSRVYDLSEIMVDDSSYLSLLDTSDNVHHLAGGTYVKLFNNLLEIKNGHVWTSAKANNRSIINTVNSVVYFEKGQFITSVNSADLKTQVLALTGEPKLASSLEPELSIAVPAGHFSFIDQEYEHGLPRNPTRVGLSSYQQIKTVFSKVKGLEKTDFENTLMESSLGNHREIASAAPGRVDSPKASKRGKTIYIKTYSGKRKPASVKPSVDKKMGAMEYYKEVVKAPKKVKVVPKAPTRFYGFHFEGQAEQATQKKDPAPEKSSARETGKKVTDKKEAGKIVINVISNEEVKEKAKRVPASAGSIDIVEDINSAFERSLKNKLENNQRHSNEVNELIDELKSFNQDYSKHY